MYLSYNNVSALKLMDTRSNWVLTSEKNKVSLVYINIADIVKQGKLLFSPHSHTYYFVIHVLPNSRGYGVMFDVIPDIATINNE